MAWEIGTHNGELKGGEVPGEVTGEVRRRGKELVDLAGQTTP
jgi:hypothetical protein